MRVAAYLRYSSDQQNAASLDDQLRNVRGYCDRQGWPAPTPYSDAAMSGARNDRPGYQRLLADSARFDVIVVDDLSRFSRDSVEVQQQIRRLRFAGVRVVGVSDSIDTDDKAHKLGVGLRGLMGELYLDELRDKTHRGLKGKALAGNSAGGLPYGYRVVGVGGRMIDPERAAIVRRIYAEYLAGASPRAIAAGLNRDGVPTARKQGAATWCMSAIYGDTKRGIGILANPIYVGQQVWNRSRMVKHPDTGRRLRKERPRSEWVITEQPELAIIDRATWEAVQRRLGGSRQPHYDQRKPGRQPRYLLSGILRCGACGGPLVMLDRRYGCGTHKDRGPTACPSTLRISRAGAEQSLLAGIKEHLLSETAFRRFQRTVAAELKRQVSDGGAERERMAKAQQERDNVMAAIKAGIITPTTRKEMLAAEERVTEASEALTACKAREPARLLPKLREEWQRIVNTLESYARDIPAARAALREVLGDRVTVTTNENGEPVAEIAAPPMHLSVVAGAGFGLYLSEPLEIPIRRSRES